MRWRHGLSALCLLSVGLVSGSQYLDKCYCPGESDLLGYDEVLRDELHKQRRMATDDLPVHTFEVTAQPGVPPVSVLQILMPEMPMNALETMTVTEWTLKKNEYAAAYQQRVANLEAAAARKKRETESGGQLRRNKRQVAADLTHKKVLLPENKVYGVHPKGGDIADSESCACTGIPTAKARKMISTHVAWKEEMRDPGTEDFKTVKKAIEKKLDDVYTANDYMITDGYAGSTVLSIGLVQLEDLDPSQVQAPPPSARKKREVNGTTGGEATGNSTTNDTTAATATPAPPAGPLPVDKIQVEVEIIFIGVSGVPAPKRDLDTILAAASGTMLTGYDATDADCKTTSLPNLNPPAFLTLEAPSSSLILPGFSVSYDCTDPTKMIPESVDPDKNFKMEVECEEGTFVWPTWPADCIPTDVCTVVPDPPASSGLERKDTAVKFRPGDKAYFTCTDPDQVVEGPAGMNMFELPCQSGGIFNSASFPNCVTEETCDSLAEPDANSGLRIKDGVTKVKIGEEAIYECIERATFSETPNGPEVGLLCKNTTSGPVMNTFSAWPVCEALPCLCLGGDLNLTIAQSLDILENSCLSEDAYKVYEDSSGNGFAVPERYNCGSFKPDAPTHESQCRCDGQGEPMLFWNSMEVVSVASFVWSDALLDAKTFTFKTVKKAMEKEINTFYMNHSVMRSSKYQRSLILQFEKGTAISGDAENRHHVRISVEHQMSGNTNMSLVEFNAIHPGWLTSVSGDLTPTFHVDLPTTVSDVHTCLNASLTSVFNPKYVVSGAEVLRTVGQDIVVHCAQSHKIFEEDKWDDDSTDNTLTIRCKPDDKFDVPYTADLPDCKARCPATKPVPDSSLNLEYDNSNGDLYTPLWEGAEIKYKCINDTMGLAVMGPDGLMEGSALKESVYTCNNNGEYDIPSVNGTLGFKQCLPRPMRCKCLGDFELPETASEVLDMYCRDEPYNVMKSGRVYYPGTSEKVDLVVPNKTRCGSLDPIELKEENKCYCTTKDEAGANEAVVMTLELNNLPFDSKFLDPMDGEFKIAKTIVEEALDELYINDAFVFGKGYVRAVVTRFYQGPTELRQFRQDTIDLIESTTTVANVSDIRDLNFGHVDREPILSEFARTEDEYEILDAEFSVLRDQALANGEAEPEPLEIWSTKVEVELQFVKSGVISSTVLKEYTLTILPDDWISNKLWMPEDCFVSATKPCFTTDVERCFNDDLGVAALLRLTHSNLPEEDGPAKPEVAVGSTVNLFCVHPTERITKDEWDADPDDFIMTVLCRPDLKFDFPTADDFPDCRSWCPAEKPIPPLETGLNVSPVDDNNEEYWENAKITYQCNDTALGIDASGTSTTEYSCVPDEDGGRYSTPRETHNETWPACQERTTTVNPPIIVAVSQFLTDSDRVLIETKTKELYISERNAGDENYNLTVLLPCLIVLLCVVMLCLCCTRIDNPLCQFCSRTYVSV